MSAWGMPAPTLTHQETAPNPAASSQNGHFSDTRCGQFFQVARSSGQTSSNSSTNGMVTSTGFTANPAARNAAGRPIRTGQPDRSRMPRT